MNEEEDGDVLLMEPMHSGRTTHVISSGASPSRAASIVKSIRSPSARLATGFLLLGTTNNALYVVILTAALELIPRGTPTGVVAFANIAPALVAKAVWPYVLKGQVRYTRRVWSCVALSLMGILIVAFLPALWTRLLGIAIASFSSGLGELTYLQLSTRYGRTGAGRGVAWFSSGTGAAGLVGSGAWWLVRPLGVKWGLLTLTFLPILMGSAYSIVLPSIESIEHEFGTAKGDYEPIQAEEYDIRESEDGSPASPERRQSTSENAAVLAVSPHASIIETIPGEGVSKASQVKLTMHDKIQLIKPMLLVYIFPLVLVYFFEYTINQGVAPTLIYPLPTSSNHPLLSLIIKQLKDYYPFYQLTYQTFVFLSRSSISIFRLPAIPKRYLWIPAILQGFILLLLISESVYSWFRESIASPLVIVFVCIEGLAGGSAYVSVFYQIGTDDELRQPDGPNEAEEADESVVAARRAQEHEYRIGCVGVGDTLGILLASLLSIPLEVSLCKAQVRRGRLLCKQV